MAAAGCNGFATRLDKGAIRRREGEFRYDDVGKRFALYVHALPKAVHAEDDGTGRLAKTFEHLVGGQAVALAYQLQLLVLEPGAQAVSRVLHRLVAREENEGPAARESDVVLNFCQACFLELAPFD